ncbi:hypothetical protein EFV37_35060 (plasmid) [Mesorhizobium loti]|uniref:Uncharacterized protein n=2 Tax=Mesorhizobium jarvisii TaxID=1777867 RepID=A0A6M7TRY1_9HYPH|nr:hypothetical protein A9K72_34405 [Mesorhizobium loti]QKC67510.1 hypothetical protein EB229_35055 [Mesorhizobium jarvisii]QKD13424.1 hypothetical protein EFV37_35060 [Mesorhizobium loti]RJT29534.1 hypothetical protein D3242_28405 [Mesorhizobium jarvisii]
MNQGKACVELGDGLVQYMAAADETMRDLREADSPLLKALLQYDAYFRRDLWEHVSPTPAFAFVLFLNAYQMFLGAARMALSGHPAAVFPLVRTALESASYGYLMEQQPALSEVWGNRHRSEADKKACRNAFTFDKAIKGFAHKAPDIDRLAKEAYEGAIDYGAHPNPKGVFGHVSINEDRPDGMVAVTHTSLYGSSHHETIRGICACLDFGFAIIGIIALSGPTATGKLQDELQALNDAKEAAIAAYQSAR